MEKWCTYLGTATGRGCKTPRSPSSPCHQHYYFQRYAVSGIISESLSVPDFCRLLTTSYCWLLPTANYCLFLLILTPDCCWIVPSKSPPPTLTSTWSVLLRPVSHSGSRGYWSNGGCMGEKVVKTPPLALLLCLSVYSSPYLSLQLLLHFFSPLFLHLFFARMPWKWIGTQGPMRGRWENCGAAFKWMQEVDFLSR